VVELVALDIKYSTVQNWYAGDENGKGGIYNFVTKGAVPGVNSRFLDAGRNWFRYYLEVPQLCISGDNSVGEFTRWR